MKIRFYNKFLIIFILLEFSFISDGFSKDNRIYEAEKLYSSGVSFVMNNQYEEAIQCFSKAREIVNTSDMYKATYAMNAKDWEARSWYLIGDEKKAQELSSVYKALPDDLSKDPTLINMYQSVLSQMKKHRAKTPILEIELEKYISDNYGNGSSLRHSICKPLADYLLEIYCDHDNYLEINRNTSEHADRYFKDDYMIFLDSKISYFIALYKYDFYTAMNFYDENIAPLKNLFRERHKAELYPYLLQSAIYDEDNEKISLIYDDLNGVDTSFLDTDHNISILNAKLSYLHYIDEDNISNERNIIINEIWRLLDLKKDKSSLDYLYFCLCVYLPNLKATGKLNEAFKLTKDIIDSSISMFGPTSNVTTWITTICIALGTTDISLLQHLMYNINQYGFNNRVFQKDVGHDSQILTNLFATYCISVSSICMNIVTNNRNLISDNDLFALSVNTCLFYLEKLKKALEDYSDLYYLAKDSPVFQAELYVNTCIASIYFMQGNNQLADECIRYASDFVESPSITGDVNRMYYSLAGDIDIKNKNYFDAYLMYTLGAYNKPVDKLNDILLSFKSYWCQLHLDSETRKQSIEQLRIILPSVYNQIVLQMSNLIPFDDNIFANNSSMLLEFLTDILSSEEIEPDLLKNAYDILLFHKQLKQNCLSFYQNEARLKGDSTYNEYLSMKKYFFNANSSSIEMPFIEQLKMSQEITDRWNNFIHDIFPFNSISSQQFPNYFDIASRLDENDIAVEFFSCDKDSLFALVLNRYSDAPHLVNLSESVSLLEEHMLSKQKDITLDLQLSETLWFNIIKNSGISDVKKIYFAPDNHFCSNVSIEHLPFNRDSLYSDKYNIYRLGSTSLLLDKNSNKTTYSSATLYGDIDYSNYDIVSTADVKCPRFAFEEYENTENIKQLPFSRKEIDIIKSIFSDYFTSKGISTLDSLTVKTGVNASEESIKENISPSKIIHIATHGKYFKSKTNQQFFYDNKSGNVKYYSSSNITNHSALLFSGAKQYLSGYPIQENQEDGVLTATEISTLDLTGTELVVLSSCNASSDQTDISNITGLISALKSCGVKSIIESTREVDDNSTMLLMYYFYKNLLIEGKGICESLVNAQRTIREMGIDSKYWEPFIVIDALN